MFSFLFSLALFKDSADRKAFAFLCAHMEGCRDASRSALTGGKKIHYIGTHWDQHYGNLGLIVLALVSYAHGKWMVSFCKGSLTFT